jgi:hypothetical protein
VYRIRPLGRNGRMRYAPTFVWRHFYEDIELFLSPNHHFLNQ